jgi:hypothetical protein
MRLPRFLWVPFELGRPFGAPHHPDFQRRVLHEALALLERTDGPVVIADFPEDAPATDDEIAWSCPVSFPRAVVDESDLRAAVTSEIAQLSPWAELGPVPAPNSGLSVGEIVERLALVADGADGADGQPVDVESVRLLADDLRSWYLHAVTQQPGRASSQDRNTWFWRETAAARLLGRLAATLTTDPNPMVRMFAQRGIVPRDHWDLLVPDPTEEHPDDRHPDRS